MSLDLEQFRDLIIEPTLEQIGLYSTSAVELVLGTAIQESRITYLTQIDGDDDPYNRAMGLFQMEGSTHDDIWINFLRYRGDLSEKIKAICPSSKSEDLIGNLSYACAMCRIHYRRDRNALPKAGDLEGQAATWKRFYNTHLGRGTEEEYVNNWRQAHQ